MRLVFTLPALYPSADFQWLTGASWLVAITLIIGALAVFFAVMAWRERRCRQALLRAQQDGHLQDDALLAQSIFAASPDAILVMDPANEQEPMAIVSCSERVCAWHGWSRAELVGRSVNLLERDPGRWTLSEARELVARLRITGVERGEAEHRHRDGSVLHVEFTNSLLVLGGREYVLGFDRDITERRRVEAALRASEQRFRAIIDASPVAIWLMDPHDTEVPLRIVIANEHAAKMHGVELAGMVGRSVNEFDVKPVNFEQAQERLQRLRNSTGLQHGQTIHRRKDGSIFPIQYITTLLVVDGREQILGIDQDITERNATEAALRASEERFRAIFNASPAGMQLQDPHDREVPLRIVDANQHAAQMHGVKLADMIGRSIGDFDASPATYEIAQARLGRLRDSGSCRGEAIHRRADGHEFPIEFVSTLIVLAGREFILGIDHEITERKRVEAELSESRRLRAVGAMVGGIAHEFNNLLTPMLLHVELLLSPGMRPSLVQHSALPLRQAVTQASELTRRILAFGRRGEGQNEVCDLAEIVGDAIQLVGKTIDRRIRLTVTGEKGSRVLACRTDLSQIVINLLLNARDTVVEKGAKLHNSPEWRPAIEIGTGVLEPSALPLKPGETAPAAGRVWLRVTDNGMGMDEAVRERVFEPFFTTKPTGRGTGLGLATVWHLVRAAGGQVVVDSRPGEGTAMHIYLPVAAIAKVEPKLEIVPVAPAPERPAGLRVVLVEDQDLVGETVVGLLSHYGHQVKWIQDGAEAWTWVNENLAAFDLIVTDINLPGLNGIDLIERMRGAGFTGKIIAYSGMMLPETETRLRRIGIQGVLAKPFQVKQLLDLI